MRATILAAGGLACAGAAMTIAAFAGGGQAGAGAAAHGRRSADRGAEVFAEQGCGSCHTFAPANARGDFGPDLALCLTASPRTTSCSRSWTPTRWSRQNWGGGVMPDDFAQRIDPRDLDPLVAYLMKGAAG